jgi:hypothetical protein
MQGLHRSYQPRHSLLSETKSRLLSLLDIVRLLEKVEQGPNECWNFVASKTHHGYGSFRYGDRSIAASRASYAMFKGDPGKGIVRHTCDNPACVNPNHLILGNQRDNMTDKMLKGRARRSLTEDQVRAIRADERPICEIARAYQVTHGTVGCIKRRQTWAWLT